MLIRKIMDQLRRKFWKCHPSHPTHLTLAYYFHGIYIFETGSHDHRLASDSLCSQGWPWTYLPTSTLQNTGIIGGYHYAQFIQYWAWTPWPQACSASILPTLYPQPKFQELKLKDSWRFPDLQANMLNRAWMSAWVNTETNHASHFPVPVCSLAVYCVVHMCSFCSVTELGWGAKVWMRWCL